MARIILITGGGRSGKSAYALGRGRARPGPRVFLATCPPLDDEMKARIRRHQAARDPADWQTLEETLDLAGALARADANVVLVDCLTLWLNNLLHEAEVSGAALTEADIEKRCRELLAAAAGHGGAVIFVTNEIGMSVIPENALARRYRDLVGRCNQVMAAAADEVILLISGIPMQLKGKEE